MKKFVKLGVVFAALVLVLSCFASCKNSSGDDDDFYYGDSPKEKFYRVVDADDLLGVWMGEFHSEDYVDKYNASMKANGSDIRIVSTTEVVIIGKEFRKSKNGHYWYRSKSVGNGEIEYNQNMYSYLKEEINSTYMLSADGRTVTFRNWKNPAQNFDFIDCGTATKLLEDANDEEVSVRINADKDVLQLKVLDYLGIVETVYLMKQDSESTVYTGPGSGSSNNSTNKNSLEGTYIDTDFQFRVEVDSNGDWVMTSLITDEVAKGTSTWNGNSGTLYETYYKESYSSSWQTSTRTWPATISNGNIITRDMTFVKQ